VEDDKSGQGASLRVPHKPHVPSRTATRVVGARGGCSHRIAGQAAVRPAPNSFPEWLVPARTARCHDPRGQTQAVMSRAKVASSRRLILGLAHRGAGSDICPRSASPPRRRRRAPNEFHNHPATPMQAIPTPATSSKTATIHHGP